MIHHWPHVVASSIHTCSGSHFLTTCWTSTDYHLTVGLVLLLRFDFGWLIEQGLTSPPTQYRLSGRQFYRSKNPPNSIKVLKERKNLMIDLTYSLESRYYKWLTIKQSNYNDMKRNQIKQCTTSFGWGI